MKVSAPVRYRKYGSIRILSDDRVRFSPWTFPELRYLNFAVSGDSIAVERGGRTVMYLSAPRGRLDTACFAFDLPRDELLTLVSELRTAGHGLERWIVPALEYTQATLHPLQHRIAQGRQLLAALPELLQSSRDLPVARTWQTTRRQLQRQWAEQVRQRPEDIARVPAPWLLPAGRGPDGNTRKGSAGNPPPRRTKARPRRATQPRKPTRRT